MAIPDAIKNNFHTLERAFRNGDIALLECRNSANSEPAYARCAINVTQLLSAEPEIEMVPVGLMFSSDPYEMLIPASDPEFDDGANEKKMKAGGNARRRRRERRSHGSA
jgi:hypothetical protein